MFAIANGIKRNKITPAFNQAFAIIHIRINQILGFFGVILPQSASHQVIRMNELRPSCKVRPKKKHAKVITCKVCTSALVDPVHSERDTFSCWPLQAELKSYYRL